MRFLITSLLCVTILLTPSCKSKTNNNEVTSDDVKTFFNEYSKAVIAADFDKIFEMRDPNYHQVLVQPDANDLVIRKTREEIVAAAEERMKLVKQLKFDITPIKMQRQGDKIIVETTNYTLYQIQDRQEETNSETLRILTYKDGQLKLWQEKYALQIPQQLKKFEVLVNGQNYLIKVKSKLAKHGFYTRCYVEAIDPKQATLKAVALIQNDQEIESLKNNKDDDKARIVIEKITVLQDYVGQVNRKTNLAWYKE